jgi:hypothetical protein
MMAIDMMMLRKLAAEKARKGKSPPANSKKEAEPDADDAAGKSAPANASAANPFVLAAAKAKERLAAAK